MLSSLKGTVQNVIIHRSVNLTRLRTHLIAIKNKLMPLQILQQEKKLCKPEVPTMNINIRKSNVSRH